MEINQWKKAKKVFECQIVRFPKKYSELIGKEAKIYEIDRNGFLISIGNELDNKLDNSYVLAKIDKNLAQKIKELGVSISTFIEVKLKELISKDKSVRPPGFEPGQRAREARVLPLDYDRSNYK